MNKNRISVLRMTKHKTHSHKLTQITVLVNECIDITKTKVNLYTVRAKIDIIKMKRKKKKTYNKKIQLKTPLKN